MEMGIGMEWNGNRNGMGMNGMGWNGNRNGM